ncbi:MAG: ABC transporter ATP-binding protein [Ardenticatenia bacterium]|nr:ABC transporter ATP-binding protein [Ardenticatenia bacterium]
MNAQPAEQLQARHITLHFGGVAALSDVSLNVRQGEILAIIGPNGAGKTSLLNCISGLYRPQSGELIFFKDGHAHNLLRLRPHHIARLGIARAFQNIELFRHMTVLENIMLGRHVHMRGNVLTCGLYWWRQQEEEIRHRRRVEEIIDFLEIENIRHKPVGTLAYGLQKRVEVARALALDPEILLLDEPMAGMNVEEKEDMARFILDINQEWDVTVVLIEHDMGVVMDLSDRVVVLDFGRVIAEGRPDEIRHNPLVVQAYLGDEALMEHLA